MRPSRSSSMSCHPLIILGDVIGFDIQSARLEGRENLLIETHLFAAPEVMHGLNGHGSVKVVLRQFDFHVIGLKKSHFFIRILFAQFFKHFGGHIHAGDPDIGHQRKNLIQLKARAAA